MKFQINVTPLIDVMLVLLILFMVMTPLSQKGLDVEIPESASTGEPAPPGRDLVLEIAEDGSLRLNTRSVPREELPALLRQLFDARRDKVLFLSAHEALPYASVVEVLDVARGNGATRVGISPRRSRP